MLNLKILVTAALIAGLLFVITSCNKITPQSPEVDGMGSLRINFSLDKDILAKTIQPDLDMNIAEYDIFGQGPNNESFSQEGLNSTTPFETSLVAGQWVITIKAYNSEDTVIGQGSENVTILTGEIVQSTVVITPLPGNGFLSLDVSWPPGVLYNPQISGTLTAADDGTSQPINFTLANDELSASYGDSLSAGYYRVSLLLTDGGEAVWGRNESAWIVKGARSSQHYELTQDTNNGGLTLTLVDGMQEPVDITLSGVIDTLVQGNEMTVTANHNGIADNYQWYLQGQDLTGENDNSITLGSSLNPGVYWLDVLVDIADVYSSEGVKFVVVPQ